MTYSVSRLDPKLPLLDLQGRGSSGSERKARHVQGPSFFLVWVADACVGGRARLRYLHARGAGGEIQIG